MSDEETPDFISENDESPDEIDVDQIQAEARGEFNFDQFLSTGRGIKHRNDKIVLFMNMPAVDAYHKQNIYTQQVNQELANALKELEKAETENRAERTAKVEKLQADFDREDERLEELRAEMLKDAVSVRLKAYPNIALKVAKRDARKLFHDEEVGGVPPDQVEDVQDWMDFRLLGESIIDITNSQGQVDRLKPYAPNPEKPKKKINPRHTIGKRLSDTLPPSQWMRLYNLFQVITLTDNIGSAAVEDPGF